MRLLDLSDHCSSLRPPYSADVLRSLDASVIATDRDLQEFRRILAEQRRISIGLDLLPSLFTRLIERQAVLAAFCAQLRRLPAGSIEVEPPSPNDMV